MPKTGSSDRPLFLVFEGVDGAGKSTQCERLAEWLCARGHGVVQCRDPGATDLGEAIRELILHRTSVPIDLRSEMLLYMAARAQLVEQLIRPALAAGTSVVCDRFLLSNVVYQGHAGGLDPELIWTVGSIAIGGVQPDLTVLLDIDADVAVARRHGINLDRIEQRGLEFLQRVRSGFLREARAQRIPVESVDARMPVEDIHRRIVELVNLRCPFSNIVEH